MPKRTPSTRDYCGFGGVGGRPPGGAFPSELPPDGVTGRGLTGTSADGAGGAVPAGCLTCSGVLGVVPVEFPVFDTFGPSRSGTI